MTQSDILLKHLSTVFDPELGANIVELGMVKDVQHVDKTVTIKLALTIADCPMRNQIETEINRKLKLLDCLLYTSPSPRDGLLSRMPSSA